MKRKLDHGSEVRSFSLGKKPCKVSEYTSTTGLVPCSATPTTFGDLRAANGQGQQRRRITSVQPPTGLQEWLKMFQVTCLTVLEMLHLIAVKNKGVFSHEKELLHATPWMNLESIMLSERSETQKATYCMIIFT